MKKNLLEWSVFAASILLLLGLIGYLAVKSVSYKDTPPDLRVSIAASTDSLQRNIYKLELVNKGAQTAENITIEVTLEENGEEVEKTEALFPQAPTQSLEEAWITFRAQRVPGQKLKVHILGYNRP
ncbi:hypothetical protein GU926_15720 [Nibribacter ruber]|uniref:TIGR02588 family protein n=1 Tax=Nibribacter ruber TaxID=2698458 RepID=A0A6P1P353_9BACT|nr:hypothetical protein [Nibribacter ruber]QHL88795.1 hypothetical protein GU926_15720 [Nibribacter ruber]